VKRRNSMITDAASPAPHASTKAELVSKLLVSALPADYAIALPGLRLSVGTGR
jgi:hypothetical protein